MSELNRRTVLGASLVVGLASSAQVMASPPKPAPKNLPVDPSTVPGLSAKLLASHYENNYLGAVKRLGSIQDEWSSIDVTKAPGYQINGLKREELVAWNSMILHELYFAGLGQADRPGSTLSEALERDFGSHDRWATEFSAMGKALGGGSGWVLLAWSERDRRLVNQWAADHTMTLAGSTPLLALDMYEHAYHMDFGAKAGAYVDAFMKAISWQEADRRYRRLV
jgi:Fe-Mn family superoxide dismutase